MIMPKFSLLKFKKAQGNKKIFVVLLSFILLGCSFNNQRNPAPITKNQVKPAKSQQDLADKTKHSTALEAGEIATKARVSQLILGHFSSRYKNLDEFKVEATSLFSNTFIAKEGKIYSF